VTLNWTADPAANKVTTYNVYRVGQTFTGPWASPTGTTFTNASGIVNGTQYCYQVSATNASGSSAESAAVCATPNVAVVTTPVVPAVPAVPTSVTASPGNAQVTLNWTANPAADKVTTYNVYRVGQTFTGPWASPTGTTFTNAGSVVNGTQYCYQVSATNTVGASAESAAVCATPTAPTATPVTPVTPVTGSGGGNGTTLFDGTFNTGLTNYTDQFFTSGSLTEINSDEEQYNITSADDPGDNGHYRADLSSSNIYPAGTPECTTIPIQFNDGLAVVPNSSWLQFSETKDSTASLAGWGMAVSSYYGGQNEFAIEFNGYASDAPAWTSGPIDTGIHTVSICTNDANDSSGEVYGIWLDGVRQTFNHGSSSGSQTLSGFAIIDDGASSWPLDVNDYTGGTPAPNQLIHGAPLVATMGSNDLPPEPTGGWNSF